MTRKADIEAEQYEFVLMVTKDFKSWQTVKQIANTSGVSITKTKLFLTTLAEKGLISTKVVNNSPVYGKNSLLEMEKRFRAQTSTEFKEAKSRFKLTPHLRDGTQPKPYVAKDSQGASLAMLSRRV